MKITPKIVPSRKKKILIRRPKDVQKLLLVDNELPILMKVFSEGSAFKQEKFWIARPRSGLYTMIIRKADDMTPELFKKNMLCLVDDNSVRVNDLYENAKHRYEATCFAEEIGKVCYAFKVKDEDFNSMWEGCRATGHNWRVKNNKTSRAVSGIGSHFSGMDRIYDDMIYGMLALVYPT